ncbi:unnamed protein product [Pseudo-nitzschia multistriata]|uniref:Uncharacterized protein n=1 Tax=Pseudo-nitzschia multistriata TaxID=183589 RepID=A0A448ZQX7_9STRA|nr:unnamed protein product [Pseudo-nitzschia multistriata]
MVKFSNQSKKTLQRKGQQLLKSKFTLRNKRRKGSITLFSLNKTKNKLLVHVPTVVLPSSFKLSSINIGGSSGNRAANTIRTVHTSTGKSDGKSSSSTMPAPLGKILETKLSTSSDKTSGNKANGKILDEKKKNKRMSIKKFFHKSHRYNTRSSLDRTSAPDGDASPISPKVVPKNATDDTLSPRSIGDYSATYLAPVEQNEGIINESSPVGDGPDDEPDDNRSSGGDTADITILTATTTTPMRDDLHSLPATSPSTTSSSDSAGFHQPKSPYIFADDEDSEHPGTIEVQAGASREKQEITMMEDNTDGGENNTVETQLDREMERLDERIRDREAGTRAVAKEQLCSPQINVENSHFVHYEEQREENHIETEEGITTKAAAVTSNRKSERQRIRLICLFSLLIPVALALPQFLTRVFETTFYDQSAILEQANSFFLDAGAGNKESPMEGVTVVVSETESSLGKQIETRFEQLGASVESVEIDCTDLRSVSESIDSLVERLHAIDYVVHTGNTCLSLQKEQTINENMNAILSRTAQGHDVLYAGNYLSSFLVTQKLLPLLEQSQFGTLVQFTSPFSTLVDESLLDLGEADSSAGFLLQQTHDSGASTLLGLPVRFAYAKLSEILQHRVVARAYPNVRTMEITQGWLGGEGGVNSFFQRVFQSGENGSTKSDPVLSSPAIDDEDLQESLYEWSQKAVWEWVKPSSPSSGTSVSELILGSPLGNGGSSLAMDRTGEDGPASPSRYLPSTHQAVTVVTSAGVAMMAMKAKNILWRSTSSWWSLE